ncbi:MAG: alpha/beta fold hydrolase [Alphaproteobacteria bacterium]|jgi:pimeloyl-ACP methyl ester carboxylesterase
MPMAKVDGGDIHYSLKGDGLPLVLLLPQSSGPVGVEPFVSGLVRAFAVITYDQRGTGQSAPPPAAGAVSIPERTEEVAGLLDALSIPQANLFCHSTGCGIGMAFASAHANRVNRLVLAAPWQYGDPFLTTMQRLRISAAKALDPYEYARFNASLLFPPAYRRRHEQGFTEQAKAAKQQDAAQISDRLEAILAFDSRPLTPGIDCATLVMTAEDDQLMPAWFGRDIAHSMPNGKYVELAGGGHMLPETRTSEVIELMLDFLGSD